MLTIRNLNEIECFIAVAASGSFSAAAIRLGTTKNSVSRFILNFEERLGEKLFRRSTRQVILTSFGEFVYEQCGAFWGSLTELEAQLSTAQAKPGGTIRILASEAFSGLFLSPHLHQFRSLCPNVKVEIIYSEDETWDLDAKDINVMVGFAHMPQLTEHWRHRKIAMVHHCLVASPDLLNRLPPIRSPHDLVDVPFLNHVARKPSNAFSLRSGKVILTANPIITANSFRHLNELCKIGLGIALTAKELIEEELAKGELVLVLPELAYREFEINVFCRPDEYKLSRIRLFMDCFAAI